MNPPRANAVNPQSANERPEERQQKSTTSGNQPSFPGFSNTPPLTSRQYEVACLIAKGSSQKKVGEDLGISPSTVSVLLQQAYKRLKIKNNIELTLWVIKQKGGTWR